MKIISGGQTGVDRAALDAAIKHNIDCGGWCPDGRLDELGKIPDRYPLRELPHGSFDERTCANVRDSDASVLFHFRELTGGTKYAAERCRDLGKAFLSIDAAKISVKDAVQAIVDLMSVRKIEVLGIGGPRASEWAGGYHYAFRAIDMFLKSIE